MTDSVLELYGKVERRLAESTIEQKKSVFSKPTTLKQNSYQSSYNYSIGACSGFLSSEWLLTRRIHVSLISMRLVFTAIILVLPSTVVGEIVDFARDVQPLLRDRCERCHGVKKQEGGLRLDIRHRAIVGGDSGPAIVAKDSAKSQLFRRVTSDNLDHRMPPAGKALSAKEIATLRSWIDAGAPWPDELAGDDSGKNHWAFRPVVRPQPPVVRQQLRVTSEIDAFVVSQLEANGLALRDEADRRTLVRRLFLDLIGIPPSVEEVRAFVADRSPDAYEKLVDRLLSSPHFGERWGRHWLDLARFAESDGYENDALRHNAWRFRDWVVGAVNRDLPFDQFTIEQLAGDLLPDATIEQKTAAGFHRNTLWNSAASADKEEFRTFAIKDRTDTTGVAWMGLTLGCAQCHSHKYDPIAHREYYQLYAFFNRTDNTDVKLDGKAEVNSIKAAIRKTNVHTRGSFLQPGEEVQPATPAFLPPLKARNSEADRLDLARWLVDPKHPLTARVAVNRLWMHLFGTGLVTTPENFGTNGARPTHPALLDWLASEFVRVGWSNKAMIRTIVLSSTYRQASRGPKNGLQGQARFRIEAEIVRDSALNVGGLLSSQIGGPSIVPPFPDGLLEQKFTNEALKMPTGDRHRRGIYIHVQRTLPHPTLSVFDGADGNQPCPRRDRSVTPLQALALLNDPVFMECARALATRIRSNGTSDEERIRFGFELCLSRPPASTELSVIIDLIETQRKAREKEEAVWIGVARVLLNLEEFTTRE